MKGNCRDDLRHAFLAEVAFTATTCYFRLTAKQILGVVNSMADALSRCKFDEVQVLLRHWIDKRSDAWVS